MVTGALLDRPADLDGGWCNGLDAEEARHERPRGAARPRPRWRPLRPAGLPAIGVLVAAFFLAPYAVMLLGAHDSSRNRQTLTVGIQQFVGLYETRYQYLFVASLIGIVPVLVRFAAIERYFMGGLTAGSVK